MIAHTRTPQEREHDRAEIARRYFQGETQAEIARTLGVTQQMVSLDLKILSDRWRKAALGNIDELKGRELAKINNLERTYWQAWIRSMGERQVSASKLKKDGDGAASSESSLRKEQRDGVPTYLAGVQWCIERRCAILGLDAPKAINIEMRVRQMAEELGIDPDEAVKEAQRILSGSSR